MTRRPSSCPACKGAVKPRDENPAFPFCSPRCRAVDLGRWFTGAYRVPGPPLREESARPGEPATEPDPE